MGRHSIVIPLSNTVFILCLICLLKYFDFGAALMGYRIVSIICYLIFLIWVMGSSPSGNNRMTLVGD